MTQPMPTTVAAETLAGLDICGLPVDPFDIARQEQIRLLPGVYDGCFDSRIECRMKGGEKCFYILYAEAKPGERTEGRVRFSIAHELGHYYMPKHRDYLCSGVWHGSRTGFVSETPTEREADEFAAALLMPPGPFADLVKSMHMSVCATTELADLARRFGTSVTSTAIRYAELNLEACCVVLSRESTIAFGIASDGMKDLGLTWVRKGSRVPSTSVLGKALAGGPTGRGGRLDGRTYSDIWFGGQPSRLLWEDSVVLGRTGYVLTLLTPEE